MSFVCAVLGNFQAGESEPWSTETHVAAALEELGCTVRRLQENAVRPEWVPALTQDADLLLWIKTWPTERNAGLAMLRAVEAQGTVTAGFHLDRWWGLAREHQVHDDPWFRTQFSFTADGGHQRQWEAAGVRHHWLPPGVHGPECVPGTWRPELAVDVGFVGSFPYPHPEWTYRNDLVNLLRRRYRNRFGLWGRGRPARGMALNDVYASVTVLVGDSCLAPDQARTRAYGDQRSDPGSSEAGQPCSKYWSDRISETLGRGGFLIHPWVEGIDEHYTDGEHLRLYELGDFGQLFALIDHYVEYPTEARRIADAGQAHVRATATYAHRMAELLGVLAAETGLVVPDAMLSVPETALAVPVPLG